MKFKMHAVLQFQKTSGSKFIKGISCCTFVLATVQEISFLQIIDKIWGIIFRNKTD